MQHSRKPSLDNAPEAFSASQRAFGKGKDTEVAASKLDLKLLDAIQVQSQGGGGWKDAREQIAASHYGSKLNRIHRNIAGSAMLCQECVRIKPSEQKGEI